MRKFLAAAGMKVRRPEVRLRGDTDPLGQLPGGSIAGEASSHMFLVYNAEIYSQSKRGDI